MALTAILKREVLAAPTRLRADAAHFVGGLEDYELHSLSRYYFPVICVLKPRTIAYKIIAPITH
jgi:hypothetical protein